MSELKLTPEDIKRAVRKWLEGNSDTRTREQAIADAATAKAVRWCLRVLREGDADELRSVVGRVALAMVANAIEKLARAEGVEVNKPTIPHLNDSVRGRPITLRVGQQGAVGVEVKDG